MTDHPLLKLVYLGLDALKAYVQAEEAEGRTVDWNYRDYDGWVDDDTGRLYDDDGYTVIMKAVKQRDRCDIIDYAVSKGADVDIVNKHDETALCVACSLGCVAEAKVLLQHEANPNFTTLEGNSPLHFACKSRYSRVALIELLLAAKANLHHKNAQCESALHIAAEYGYVDAMKVLVSAGLNVVNEQDENGNTVLHRACRSEVVEAVRFTLERGVNIDAQNKKGLSALMIAAQRDNVDIVKLLVLKGANQELKNKEGKAVADIAGSFSKSMFNQDGAQILLTAAEDADFELIRTLLAKGVNVNVQHNENRQTALMILAYKGYLDMVKMLVEHGADIKLEDNVGKSAYVHALVGRHNHIAEYLKQQLEEQKAKK